MRRNGLLGPVWRILGTRSEATQHGDDARTTGGVGAASVDAPLLLDVVESPAFLLDADGSVAT